MMRSKDWLSTSEVAEKLAVTRQTVNDWIRVGKLPADRVGKRWRVKPEALRHVVKEQGTDDE